MNKTHEAAALLGKKGGRASAKKLTAAQRSARSRRAARLRWAKARKKRRKAYPRPPEV